MDARIRLESAVARLEAALEKRAPVADAGLARRHAALKAEAETALSAIDRLLAREPS